MNKDELITKQQLEIEELKQLVEEFYSAMPRGGLLAKFNLWGCGCESGSIPHFG